MNHVVSAPSSKQLLAAFDMHVRYGITSFEVDLDWYAYDTVVQINDIQPPLSKSTLVTPIYDCLEWLAQAFDDLDYARYRIDLPSCGVIELGPTRLAADLEQAHIDQEHYSWGRHEDDPDSFEKWRDDQMDT